MDEPVLEVRDGAEAWRESREPGWFRDVGYVFEKVLGEHRYDIKRKGIKPDDPGWHECSCGNWQGYWSGFHPHLADHLRAAVIANEHPSEPRPKEAT